MSDGQKKDIARIRLQLDRLILNQNKLNDEITELRDHLKAYKEKGPADSDPVKNAEMRLQELVITYNQLTSDITALKEVILNLDSAQEVETENAAEKAENIVEPTLDPPAEKEPSPFRTENLERFIGTNLLNKVGIVILVIGAGIGIKYAIDRDLISPIMRIALSYLLGFGLVFTAYRLVKNHNAFSAVLLSGGLTILYFTTFFAYDLYGLINEIPAYALMLVFTVFTVFAAIQYDRQIIGILGLAGSYAIPFLISKDPGNIVALSTYVAIINTGILVVSYFRYWKWLQYVAFVVTWFIFGLWFDSIGYDIVDFKVTAIVFPLLYFIQFYGIFLANKIIRKEEFQPLDTIAVILNAGLFFGFIYDFLERVPGGTDWQGLITVGNALIHLAVVLFLKQRKVDDDSSFHVIIGMVILFLTLAIPIQLDGSWVTIVWAIEGAALYFLYTKSSSKLYELGSYILFTISFFSLLQDWYAVEPDQAFLNTRFLTGVIYSLSFIYVLRIKSVSQNDSPKFVYWLLSAYFLIGLYGVFQVEIYSFWTDLYQSTFLEIGENEEWNYNLILYRHLFFKIFSLVFIIGLGYLILKREELKDTGYVFFGLSILVVMISLTNGIGDLGDLRNEYLLGSEYFNIPIWNILIRYPYYALIFTVILINYKLIRQRYPFESFLIGFQFAFHITMLTFLSNELIHWLELGGAANSDKLGLSILWGVYSSLIIILGIWKNRKHFRIGGIVLFSVTLLKLFFYDLTNLTTIAKTIVFITLGIFLLIASFLYNKFKDKIYDQN